MQTKVRTKVVFKDYSDPYRTENLKYDESDVCYTCPMGQKMSFLGDKIRV